MYARFRTYVAISGRDKSWKEEAGKVITTEIGQSEGSTVVVIFILETSTWKEFVT